LAQRQQRRIAATSAALPGSTKTPLHLFATHIVDRHDVMTHGTFFLQWWHVHQAFFRRRTLGAAPAARPCLIHHRSCERAHRASPALYPFICFQLSRLLASPVRLAVIRLLALRTVHFQDFKPLKITMTDAKGAELGTLLNFTRPWI
jgi:hypothetical protein